MLGGPGGNVNTFVNSPTNQSAVPTSVVVLGGNGGTGISDRGGLGGTIQAVNVTASGLSNGFTTTTNKALAGAGGASCGTDGGNGGAILNTTLTSVSTPLAVASGAGGVGLLSGGVGGTVSGSTLNSAGTPARFGKLLIVATREAMPMRSPRPTPTCPATP